MKTDMKLKKYIYGAVALSMLCLLPACNDFRMQTDYKYVSQPLDPHIEMNAWEYMLSREDMSEMVEAVTYTGLEHLYTQTDEVLTYLFLNNDAIASFRNAHSQVAKIEYCDRDQVERLLRYHIVLGEYHALNKQLPVQPIYVKTLLDGEWGLMTLKVNKSSSNSIGSPIANGNIVANETSSNFRSKRIGSVSSNIFPTNGVIHIFNDYSMFRKTSTDVTPY